MAKKLFAVLFISVLYIQLFADNDSYEASGNKGIIAGRIVDENNLPLPGATVIIKSIHNGTVTDANGFYKLLSVVPGEYEVCTTYIGFKAESKPATVKAGKITLVNFDLKAGLEIDEVVVNGSLQGQSKAINQQKNNINISNIISSDQATRFPDANIGDALKRIPGINVQYDQGEARFGHIRGTAPEYNSVTVDGNRIPSAEAEIRAIQLDLIPSDMIQSIEVNKVVTPDMDADAIGGSVNLVTRSNPYKQRFSGTVGTVYNFLREKPAENISLVYGNRFFDDVLGMTLSASRNNHILGSDDIEAEWDDDGTMKELQIRTYKLQRLRQSYSAAFDLTPSPLHKFEAKVMYNHRNDWENRYRTVYKDLDEDESQIERQSKGGTNKNARLEDQRTYHVSLKGEHQFGALGIKWKASYAKANEERPNERYIEYKYKDVAISQNLTDTRKPTVSISNASAKDLNSSWGFNEITEEYQYTEDIDKVLGLDFSLPLKSGQNSSKLKFGVKYKGKSKNRDNDFYAYEPKDEDAFNAKAFSNMTNATKDNYLPGDQYDAGNYIGVKFLGSLNLESSEFDKEQDPEELAGNFDATEDVVAAYVRFDKTFGKLDLLAGIRLESTLLEYSGYEILLDKEGDFESLNKTDVEESNYTNILPSLLFKYNFSENTQLKAAWTNTIARPRYFDLVPHVETNKEDNEISIGNTELDPTKSMNLDLMIEHYYNSVGLISAGAFYKKIQDFIVEEVKDDYSYLNNTWDEFKQPINGGDANLYGFEFAFQRQFDFMPGILRQCGIYTNYTYTKSEVSNFQIKDREDEEMALPGTPNHNLNASLYYEGKKLSARISFNYASDFIDEVGGEAFEDRYYDQVTYLDLNANYMISKKFNVYFELNNLLNQPLRYFQGSSEFTMQEEYYNSRMNIGFKFDF